MTPVGWTVNVEYESQESGDGNSGMKTTGSASGPRNTLADDLERYQSPWMSLNSPFDFPSSKLLSSFPCHGNLSGSSFVQYLVTTVCLK